MSEDVLDLPREEWPPLGCERCGDREHELFTLWPASGITAEAVNSGLWPRLLCEVCYNQEVADEI